MKKFVVLCLAFAVFFGAASCALAVMLHDYTRNGYVGEDYSIRFSASYVQSYWGLRWSTGGQIPPGLSFASNSNGGADIKGTPTKAGRYSFTVTVYDNWDSSSRYCTVTIWPARPSIITTSLDIEAGYFGRPYELSFDIEIYNPDSAALSWEITSGDLPGGLELDADTGIISGTPTETGDYTFTVKVSNYDSESNLTSSREGEYTITVEIPDFEIITETLADGKIETEYSAALSADISGVKWEISGGALPDGLTLDADKGIISGTPTKADGFEFTVRAYVGEKSTEKTFTITIEDNTTTPSDPEGGNDTPSGDTPSDTDSGNTPSSGGSGTPGSGDETPANNDDENNITASVGGGSGGGCDSGLGIFALAILFALKRKA